MAGAFALVNQGRALLDAGEENLPAAMGLFREAENLLKEEYEDRPTLIRLGETIADLRPILSQFGITMDWYRYSSYL
jgi:hypothetical protein